MGLKEGTLESLVESGADASAVAYSVFPHMLRALDCLDWKGIIHRDVKPENILYVTQPGGQYQFQLGDFGLCNRAVDATTHAGSAIYMAPEMFRKGGQTSKLDVWSLFVTILWTLDVGGFRQESPRFDTVEDAQNAVLFAASKGDISNIREMATIDPARRASAAQMLVKCFNGEGLSTPRHQVPALPIGPSATITPVKPQASTAPTLTARTTRLRGLQKDANVTAAAAQHRNEKARDPLQPQPSRRLPELRQRPHARS